MEQNDEDCALDSKKNSNMKRECDTSWMNDYKEYKKRNVPVPRIKGYIEKDRHCEYKWFNDECREANSIKIYYRRKYNKMSKKIKGRNLYYYNLYTQACTYSRKVINKAKRQYALENGLMLTKDRRLKFTSDSVINTRIPVENSEDNFTNTKEERLHRPIETKLYEDNFNTANDQRLSTETKLYGKGEDIHEKKSNELQSNIKNSSFGNSAHSSTYPYWSDMQCRKLYLLKDFCWKMVKRYPDCILLINNLEKVTKILEEMEANFKKNEEVLNVKDVSDNKLGYIVTDNTHLTEKERFNSTGDAGSSNQLLNNYVEDSISNLKFNSSESENQLYNYFSQHPEEEFNSYFNDDEEYFVTKRKSFAGDFVKNESTNQLQHEISGPGFIPKLKERNPHSSVAVHMFNGANNSREALSSIVKSNENSSVKKDFIFNESNSSKTHTMNTGFPSLVEKNSESPSVSKVIQFGILDSFKKDTANPSYTNNDQPDIQEDLKHRKVITADDKAIPFPPPPPNIGSLNWSTEQQSTKPPDHFGQFKYSSGRPKEVHEPIKQSHKHTHAATSTNQSRYKSNKMENFKLHSEDKLGTEHLHLGKMDRQFHSRKSFNSPESKYGKRSFSKSPYRSNNISKVSLSRSFRHANRPNSQYNEKYSHKSFSVSEPANSKEADAPRAFPPPPPLSSSLYYNNKTSDSNYNF